MFAPSQHNELSEGFESSLADDLDQYPFTSSPVELTVEDLLPRAEVEIAPRHRDHRLTPHHQAPVIRKILDHVGRRFEPLGLPGRAPPLFPEFSLDLFPDYGSQ